MSFKTILVSMNDVARGEHIADAACKLASKHKAHLIGLFVIPVMPVYPAPGAYVLPELIENHEAIFAERGDKAKAIFEDVTGRYEVETEWRLVNDGASVIANAVIEHGHQADLVVLGQVDPDNNDGIELDFADQVVMETGRPVLVVPNRGEFATVGEHVLVGWNATQQSARAAFDAVPILSGSKDAWLTWVDPQKSGETADSLPGAELAASLARHGVKVKTDPLPGANADAGGALLSRAADLGADMLVVGAYGHSRMREYVFGGATRELLKTMTVPVLMSH